MSFGMTILMMSAGSSVAPKKTATSKSDKKVWYCIHRYCGQSCIMNVCKT